MRRYWVVFKLLITVVATLILLMYTQTLSAIANAAAESADLVAVYKPSGRTPYGWRKQEGSRKPA